MDLGQNREENTVSGTQHAGKTIKPQGRRYVKRSAALTLVGLILLHSILGNNGSEARTSDNYAGPVAAPVLPRVAPKPRPVQVVDEPEQVVYREVNGKVRKGDTLISLLTRHGVANKTAHFLGKVLHKQSKLSRDMQIDDPIRLIFDSEQRLLAFGYQVVDHRMVLATLAAGGDFAVKSQSADLSSLNEAKVRQLFPQLVKAAAAEKVAEKPAEKMAEPAARAELTPVPAPTAEPLARVGKPVAKGEQGGVAQRINALVNTGSANLVEEKVRKGDGLADILGRRSVSHETTMALAKAAKPVYDLASQLTPGKTLNLAMGEDGGLMGISYAVDPEHTFWLVNLAADGSISANDEGKNFVPKLEKKEVETRATTVGGTIRSSLFEDGRKAGLSHTMLVKMAGLFEWDVDFAKEIQRGDRFKVVFEERVHKGKRIGEGVILAAEFVNGGKAYRVVRFADTSGKSGYYTPDGNSIRRMFIKAPMDYTRISSGFASSRLHPVYGFNRAHKGVDYAAPTGTPVRAAGDGIIDFVGNSNNGFGNLILVRHNAKYTTAYAHLSRFESGITKGSRVTQGQTIGRVGTTGVSTGPHLHYELRVNGDQVNPLSVQPSIADTIERKQMAQFKKAISPHLAMLESTSVVAALPSKSSKD